MSKRILIDASNAEETRVAVTDNGKLDDYEIETGQKNAVKGDVYLAKITRVEPSLQAAFVDFGSGRNGFLPLTEIHPDYFKIPIADQEKLTELLKDFHSDDETTNETSESFDKEIEESSNDEDIKKDDSDENQTTNDQAGENQNEIDENENKNKIRIKTKIKIKKNDPRKNYINFFRKYKIQDVIKPRQVILVQINKEERGFKGAALTTFLSFAGRYCVLMPNSLNNDGISRKIGDVEERKKLKKILESVSVPEKMSIIVRTAGIGKTKREISKDLSYLTNQWNKIRELTLKSEAPNRIHEEGNIIIRTIRDMVSDDVDEILIDGKTGFDNAKKLIKNIIPTKLKNVKIFKSKEKSLFIENNIESQINELFSLTVKLESGGSIVINTTEALVAIDVNSGKNTSERNIESTALKTNLEAATEVARQLRLRDLGGLVVIDFIDMEDYRNNFKVEKTIKTALYRDRARVQVGRISMFGLLELSRQRLRSSLIDQSFEKCPYCLGSGIILNANSISEQIMKIIKEKIVNNKGLNIKVKCNSSLAENILNDKKEEIYLLEKSNGCKIIFNFENYFSLHEPAIEVEGKLKEKKIEKTKNKKKTSTKKIAKKKEIKIKPRKKRKLVKADEDNNDSSAETDKSNIESNNQKTTKKVVQEKDDKSDDKSGWWSE